MTKILYLVFFVFIFTNNLKAYASSEDEGSPSRPHLPTEELCIKKLRRADASAKQNAVKNLFKEQVNSAIISVDALTDFFMQTTDSVVDNRVYIQAMATDFFKLLNTDERYRIVERLMLIHRHEAQKYIHSLAVGYVRGEGCSREMLLELKAKAVGISAFQKLKQRGDRIQTDSKFKSQLKNALVLLMRSRYQYELQNAEAQTQILIQELIGLNDPILIGQFIELFENADTWTQLYIVYLAIEGKEENGSLTFHFKHSLDRKSHKMAESLAAITKKSVEFIQEEAFIIASAFRANFLVSAEDSAELKPLIIKVALRHIRRLKYDIRKESVRYAANILLQSPNNIEVDETMTLMLADNHLDDKEKTAYQETFAIHALMMRERYAKNLSQLSPDIAWEKTLLSQNNPKKRPIDYVVALLRLHADYNLNNFVELRDLAIKYFQRNPDSLNLNIMFADIIDKFKRDFGL